MNIFFGGLSNAETTLWVFTIILLSFLVIPMHYSILGQKALARLQNQSFLYDWRFWVPCLLYTILLGYRWDYCYDWMQYHDDFVYIDSPWAIREDTEEGYLIVNRILSKMGFDFYSIFLLEGFLYVTSFYYLFKKDRIYLVLVLPIVFIENRNNCLNISRQFFAMSIFIFAYAKLLRGDKLWYFVLAGFSVAIHSSAIIWVIPLYFSPRLRLLSSKQTILLYFFTIILMPIVQSSFAAISNTLVGSILQDKQYDIARIMEERYLRELDMYRQIVNVCKDLVYIYFLYIYWDDFKRNKILQNILLVGLYALFCKNLAGPHEIFSRTFYYITIFTNMGMGVLFYHLFKNQKTKKDIIRLLLASIVCVQIVYSMYSSIFAGFLNVNTNLYIIYK